MAALHSRCGHSILHLWVVSFFLFFLAYSQRSPIGCLPYFHAWCGLSANLECRSEMWCSRLTENTGCKNYAKNAFCASSHNFVSDYISTTKAYIDNRKKNLLNSNISSTCARNMVNFGRLIADIGWRVWGTPANFNASKLRYCTDVAQQRSTKLCMMFGRLLGW